MLQMRCVVIRHFQAHRSSLNVGIISAGMQLDFGLKMCQSSAFSECVQDEVGSKNRCPECGLPAIMRNLQANRPIDALSECVQKLRPMKERHESLLASCSFSDEKEHIHPESKRRRIHPAKADSEIDSASRELHHVDVTEHTGCLTKSDKSHLSQQQEVDHHRRSNAESVKIIYTGVSESDDVRLGEGERHYCQSILNDDLSQEEINQALAKVGGTDFKIEIFQDADWIHEEVAHVIATVNSQRLCRRTQKYLDGIIKGKWIVGHQWLVDSISAGFWMNERYYEVKGDLTTGISFAARKGRELRANESGLFDGLRIYFQGEFQHFPTRNDLMLMARSAGARILQRRPARIQVSDACTNSNKLDVDRPLVVLEEIPAKWKKSQEWLINYQVVPTKLDSQDYQPLFSSNTHALAKLPQHRQLSVHTKRHSV